MKRLGLLLLVALSATAMAQTVPLEANVVGANTDVVRNAPSYSDVQCAGFVTREHFPKTNYVVAGWNAPHSVRYAEREIVYLKGAGYVVGNKYSVVRNSIDQNRMEVFPGQNKMLTKMGNLYADAGRVRVIRLEGDMAVAEVEFACDAIVQGDTVIPLQDKPQVEFGKRPPLEKFDGYSGTSVRVVMGRNFDVFLGRGNKFYTNIGSAQGLKPGDYVRITRNYDPKRMAPVDRVSFSAPSLEDTQKEHIETTKRDLSKLPYRSVGEGVVLYTTVDSATIMITNAPEDVNLGDVVETTGKQ